MFTIFLITCFVLQSYITAEIADVSKIPPGETAIQTDGPNAPSNDVTPIARNNMNILDKSPKIPEIEQQGPIERKRDNEREWGHSTPIVYKLPGFAAFKAPLEEKKEEESELNKNFKKTNPEDDIQRYILEDDLKRAIFGSYSYDPVRQIFESNGKKSTSEDPTGTPEPEKPEGDPTDAAREGLREEPSTLAETSYHHAQETPWWNRGRTTKQTTRWAYKNLTNLLKNVL